MHTDHPGDRSAGMWLEYANRKWKKGDENPEKCLGAIDINISERIFYGKIATKVMDKKQKLRYHIIIQ